MRFTEDQIRAQLDKIVSDKTFSRSKINVRLLRFLVQSTLEGRDLKETVIGTEFFGKKYDPIKSDNKVRVYIYHLRKKLEDYYRNSATSEDIVFTIDKGQYKVSFEAFKAPTLEKETSSKWWYMLGTIIVFSSIAVFVYKKPINTFWADLMKNELSTTVVFGDYFTIEGPITTSEKGIIRDYEINSEAELEKYLEKHPEQASKLIASKHHYFNWMAPYCSRTITEFWGVYDYPFNITQVSEWSVSQIEKENLVYFGQSKSMGVLKNILVEKFPNYTYKSQRLERKDPKTNETTVYGDVVTYNDKIIDYTIVAKISMPTGNEMRFFLSDQDCGAISALDYFTQNDSVKAFYNRHHIKKDEDFIALFKVTGWQRKSYDMEFVLLDKN
ncbi:helix-turn-helix domain-containing protein [Seonamhaeicola marinus]|uniref:Winged helix-turn-helix domain-containing protein n=1 Tax=Seonamhaeicola marinus TaxID=1912246 RepID=A0A5D0HEN2_9FLAO|nr:helix-turn-helix domain-containing protein [Seonamhaeicola marinus]TYA69803.1 winged helix-turn-helix domain-containing protein [Seonamhaeicola marinus]